MIVGVNGKSDVVGGDVTIVDKAELSFDPIDGKITSIEVLRAGNSFVIWLTFEPQTGRLAKLNICCCIRLPLMIT